MNQKQAVIKALEILGGKGELTYIYLIAIYLIGNNHQSHDIKANIRRCLYSNPDIFCSSNEGDKSMWMLKTYYNEQQMKDKKIMELVSTIDSFQNMPTIDDYVAKQIDLTKTVFDANRIGADPLRLALEMTGYKREANDLRQWIREEKDSIKIDVQRGGIALISELKTNEDNNQ